MADETTAAVDLSQLLAALAAGARAVQGLPLEDDFAFESSFPEFATLLQASQNSLLETLTTLLPDVLLTVDPTEWQDMNDPLLWEQCADACDILLEQVEQHLQQQQHDSTTSTTSDNLAGWSNTVRSASTKSYSRMLQNMVDMEKPQDIYRIQSPTSRIEPFVPNIAQKANAITALNLSLVKGHGLETRFGTLRTMSVPDDVVAPTHHVPHVYQTEIQQFSYTPQQLQARRYDALIPKVDPLTATWIDTPTALQELAEKLSQQVDEIAIDLEAHNYRSFSGIVCLMQISIRKDNNNNGEMQNYLVDTLALFHDLQNALAPILTNPNIVKVMHGADSDVPWLQRDFGLYVVNLFDTGRAARALQLKSAGYAHLLQHYCGIQADKSHQLADWRQRPLPSSMQQYAIQDTHYLLDIYERLKWDLQQQHGTSSIEDVLDVSRQVCLIRYAVEPFKPSGYKMLLSRGRRRTELIGRQENALQMLWDWRDETARQHDESLAYVCTNEALLRMAMACPTTVAGLQRLFHPVPPLMLRFAHNLLDRIKDILQQDQEEEDDDDDVDDDDILDEEDVNSQPVGAPSSSSAFFKPANAAKDRRRRGMMSPVLGTEALYKQAGWMTQQEQQQQQQQQQQGSTEEDQGVIDVTTSTTGTDDDDRAEESDGKPKRMLSVHTSNKNYSAKQYAEHSMEMGKEGVGRGRSVDGLATVRAARESSKSPGAASIEDEVKLARQNSARIRSGIAQKESIPAVLGLISPSTEVDDEEAVDADTGAKDRDGTETDEEEFAIPRSMREIYKVSNRNRRNKKAGSPTPERGVTPTSEKERDELATAEALLKERGLIGTGYFEENPASPGKRPRTKSRTGRESEESVPQESSSVASKEDDLAFMKEIGWIQGKEDVQSVLGQRYGRSSTETGGDEAEEQQPDPAKDVNYAAYDYSTAGPIGALSQTPSSNPFFAGAAMTGGPLTQGFARQEPKQQKKRDNKKGNQNRRQQERPKKEDGRTHAYRKR